MKLPLPRIAEFISAIGEYDNHGIAQGYSIDSRTIQPGELFFAVQGERLDGHDFVEQALRAGARMFSRGDCEGSQVAGPRARAI
jgi:UDP-N-acetylmuramoyl-tripeptide--D-alanyl-D-alanine ligase